MSSLFLTAQFAAGILQKFLSIFFNPSNFHPMTQLFNCIHCGDSFQLSSDDFELLMEGYITTPETCPDCAYNQENPENDYPEFSDADPSL